MWLIVYILGFPYFMFRHFHDLKAQQLRLYGIYGYFGLPGKGKTMTMCWELQRLRKKYGDQIYIMTNFHYLDQDFEFTGWKDLLMDYDRPLVVAWDEVQNEFNSRDFKSFPIALLTLLTQVRKKNGIQILYTAQRWHFVDKNFRTLSFGCYDCATLPGGFTVAKMYDPIDYDSRCSSPDYEHRRRIRPKKTIYFTQTEVLRNSYDSYKMLQSAKSKEYMSRDEISQINQMNVERRSI